MSYPGPVPRGQQGASTISEDDEVLRAIAAEDLDAVEDLADRWWYELPARFGVDLLELFASLPDQVLVERPRLLVTALLAHQFVAEGEDLDLRATMQAYTEHGAVLQGRLKTFTRPADAIAAGIMALVSARLRGAYVLAERIGEWVEQRIARLDAHGPMLWNANRVAKRPGLVALHRGLTCLLAGEPGRAAEHFARSYAQAGPPPYQHFAGVAACANLALLAAVQGYHHLAHEWLDRAAGAGPVPPWLERHLLLGAWLTQAHLAIDRLDRPAADAALDRVGTGSGAAELWPFAAAVRASYAVTFTSPTEGLMQLDAALLAHGISVRPGPDLGGQLLRARADLLVAMGGEGDPVLSLQRQGRPPRLAPAVARVHLLAESPGRALTVAERALGDPTVSPREIVELQLVCAVAHLRRGEHEQACRAFARALELREHGLLSPFVQVSADELLELCRLHGTEPEALAPALSASSAWERRPITLLTLTRTEHSVLRALSTGATATKIAHQRGVSVNTVRSQVKSLYRKLGASDRSTALARAAKLHLLPPE